MGVIYEPAGRAREYGNLAVNLYTGGCPHRCVYCYVPSALHITRERWQMQEPKARPHILSHIVKELPKLARTRPGECIFLCFTCDPYPAVIDTSITRAAIQLIHSYGFGVQILTKGGRRAVQDLELLGPQDWFGVTLTFLNPVASRKFEPGAALPFERMEVLGIAHALGIPAWVSLEPVLDPAETLRCITATHKYVDLYKVGKLNHHPLAQQIDWPKFGHEAVELLESLGKRYYVKRDLAELMEAAEVGK